MGRDVWHDYDDDYGGYVNGKKRRPRMPDSWNDDYDRDGASDRAEMAMGLHDEHNHHIQIKTAGSIRNGSRGAEIPFSGNLIPKFKNKLSNNKNRLFVEIKYNHKNTVHMDEKRMMNKNSVKDVMSRILNPLKSAKNPVDKTKRNRPQDFKMNIPKMKYSVDMGQKKQYGRVNMRLDVDFNVKNPAKRKKRSVF
jgi:hypothetical protein